MECQRERDKQNHSQTGYRKYPVVNVETERTDVNYNVVLPDLVVGINRIHLTIGNHRIVVISHCG